MGLFRRKPKPESQSQRPQVPARPDPARAAAAPPTHALLDLSHPVFQLELGMDPATVVGLLGKEYLSVGSSQILSYLKKRGPVIVDDDADDEDVDVEPSESWLYSNTLSSDIPAGHSIEVSFRSGSLVSVKVKRKSADGETTVLMKMDRARVEAAPQYQAFVDGEIQRRARRAAFLQDTHQEGGEPPAPPTPVTGKPVEKVVILHAGDKLSPGELRALLNHVQTTLAVETNGVVLRDLVYDVSPEDLTVSFGMAVLARLESKGEITNDPASPAWVGEVGVNGQPRVIIVSYKQAL